MGIGVWGWVVICTAAYLVVVVIAMALCKAEGQSSRMEEQEIWPPPFGAKPLEEYSGTLSFVGGEDDIKMIWEDMGNERNHVDRQDHGERAGR